MGDFDEQHPADDEKGSQQVHPAKPPRDGDAADGDPNEAPRGRPQHEPRNPDEEVQ